MGKASNRKKLKAHLTDSQKMSFNQNEGTITVSFVFDGIQYTKKHQLTASEMHHMKQLCREHGDLAADQMIWKVAVRGMGLVAENIMAKAALNYIKKHYKGPVTSIGGSDERPQISTSTNSGQSKAETQDSSVGEASNEGSNTGTPSLPEESTQRPQGNQ